MSTTLENYALKIEQANCPDPAIRRVLGSLLLLQEKWVLFIVYRLLAGSAGFNELSRTTLGVNTTTLSQRLDLLEEAGLVSREVHSVMPPRTSYALTEAGQALRPMFAAIADWSEHFSVEGPCPSRVSDDAGLTPR